MGGKKSEENSAPVQFPRGVERERGAAAFWLAFLSPLTGDVRFARHVYLRTRTQPLTSCSEVGCFFFFFFTSLVVVVGWTAPNGAFSNGQAVFVSY